MLGFIGAGKMAESIARGVIRSRILPASRISTSHSSPLRREAFESFGIRVLSKNEDVVEESDVVVFSVKPQVAKIVFLQLKPLLSKKKLLFSVAARIKLKDLEEWAGSSRFIRVMPNTPPAIGETASVMSLGGAATEEDGNIIAKLFGSVGKSWKAYEKYFDAVTGLRHAVVVVMRICIWLLRLWPMEELLLVTARPCIGASFSNSARSSIYAH